MPPTSTLTPPQQEALYTLCVMAAFADGATQELERSEIKRIGEMFPDLHAAAIYQRVLLQSVKLEEIAHQLPAPELRRLGYELAICVCEADEAIQPAEQEFLDRLARVLEIEASTAANLQKEVDQVALSPVPAPPAMLPSVPPAPSGAPLPDAREAEAERASWQYAILNGALELLPESLATMAIIPLQMKLVYEVGKLYGVRLDQGHIKEFLATAGIGLTSQVVEGFARKLVGGLFGKVGGGLARGLAGQATGSAITFASTYALGRVAQRYYAGGRTMSQTELRGLFDSLLGNARSLHERYLPQIQQEARTLDLKKVLSSIGGGR
jgi:uncharacterized protein (DUF697 family)